MPKVQHQNASVTGTDRVSSLLEMDDDQLVQNRVMEYRDDLSHRDNDYDIDFEKAQDLYEARSTDTEGQTDGEGVTDDIPRVNMIRRAVEDHVAVATTNIPKCRMMAAKAPTYGDLPPAHAELVDEAMMDSVETMNRLIDSILVENDYPDEVEHAARQAGVYGVGYLKVELDTTVDTRKSLELRDLFEIGPARWNRTQAKRFLALSRRIDVSHVNTPSIVWQRGVRRYGPDMLRVHQVEHVNTEVLRAQTGNDNIRPGFGDFRIDEEKVDQHVTTAVLTTWEQVPIVRVKDFGLGIENDELGQGMMQKLGEIEINDWVLLKTVIAGGELLEKEITESSAGSIRLPIVPIYLRESEIHPYGLSLALMLELSEKFINAIRALMYQSSLKALSPEAVIGVMQDFGEEDADRIDEVLQHGGFAWIKGNQIGGRVNIKEMIQPIISQNPGISNALIQAMQLEEKAFQDQSMSLDLNQVNRAESGAAKRAQIAAFDRPKTITLNMLAKAVERVYESVFEIIRTAYREEDFPVRVMDGSGDMQEVRLNVTQEFAPPLLDEDGEPMPDPENPEEPLKAPISIVINDTSIVMKAQAEGRSEMPMDMVGRFMLFKEFASAQLFRSPSTFRDLVLNDKIKAKDDSNARKEQGGAGGDGAASEAELAQQLVAEGLGGADQIPPQSPVPSASAAGEVPQAQSLTRDDRASDGLQ